MKGALGWMLGIGFLAFAMLSALLATREGLYSGLSAVSFALAGLFALPPTGARLYQRITRSQPTDQHLLTWVLLLLALAILLAGLALKQHPAVTGTA
jgi:hypothetical protein